MTYVLVYEVGTVNVVACVRQCVADQRYANDDRYTLVMLKPPPVR